jgi:hypothetical protein
MHRELANAERIECGATHPLLTLFALLLTQHTRGQLLHSLGQYKDVSGIHFQPSAWTKHAAGSTEERQTGVERRDKSKHRHEMEVGGKE